MVDSSGQKRGQLGLASPSDEAEAGVDTRPRELPTRLLEHVEVTVEAILGDCVMKVADIAKLNAGDVLELDRQLNEAVEIRVNGRVIGCGEIVSVDDKFAVRITRIG